MADNTVIKLADYSNVIPFEIIQGGKKQKDDGAKKSDSYDSSEVYAFRTKEEIAAMIDVFDKHIADADTDSHKQIASRNKMLFVIGINTGIRASDLRNLRYSFFFDKQNDGSLKFKKSYTLMPKKTRKQRKFVKLYFNKTVQKCIADYIEQYPIKDINDYLFASRKGNNPVTVEGIRQIIKAAAVEAGITQNIGSHSLRKTWAFHCWHDAEDKNKALVTLQQCFNHSSSIVTMRYIGLMDEEIKDMYNSIELGFDMI